MLAGKRILITGVLTKDSIAFWVADEAQRHGAEVILTSFGRARSMTERAAKRLMVVPKVLELDVTKPADFERLRDQLAERWDRVDGVLHAIASAPRDALGGSFLSAPGESAVAAFLTSAVSFRDLAVALRPLLREGSSLVALDFDGSVAWPAYDWMGVAKASLESIGRYLARDLGPSGVRVNLVAAGPLKTVSAAGAFSGFAEVAEGWDARAPLGWDAENPGPVAGAVCFMLSDWSAGVSGEILKVDGGFHAVEGEAVREQGGR
jgi:meromycolic acid enoyl-[acyl-carrier protein] reductase